MLIAIIVYYVIKVVNYLANMQTFLFCCTFYDIFFLESLSIPASKYIALQSPSAIQARLVHWECISYSDFLVCEIHI